MRQLVLLLVLAWAPVGLAQEVVPDTTDPASYYPLAVGNQWEYEPETGYRTPFATHFRHTIIGDTQIDGETWFIQRDQGFRGPGYGWERMNDEMRFLRFDPDSAAVLQWRDSKISWFSPCRMDGPMGPSECETDQLYASRRKDTGTVTIGIDEISTVLMSFDGAVVGPTWGAGIGEVRSGHHNSDSGILIYASIGDSTYGAPIVGMPYVPDLTPPWEYYPLAIGNIWEYERCDPPSIVGIGPTVCGPNQRVEIARDTIAAGTRYLARTTRAWIEEASVWSGVQSTDWVRFDTTTARVVTLLPSEEESQAPCRLDADFSTPGFDPPGTCAVFPRDPSPEGSVAGGTVKSIAAGTDSGETYEAGIGLVGWGVWHTTWTVTYARVRQPDGSVREIGAVAINSDASPTTAALTLRAGPSPTAGPVTLALDLPDPQPVELAAFDALGRRVWHAELAAGRERIQIDASSWAPGLYVVRAIAGDASATATVVRR